MAEASNEQAIAPEIITRIRAFRNREKWRKTNTYGLFGEA